MLFIGVDPDLHCTAFAAVEQQENGRKRLFKIGVVKRKGKKDREAVIDMSWAIANLNCSVLDLGMAHKKVHAVAVESQEIIYSARSGVNPRDLLLLANISGAVMGRLRHFTACPCHDPEIYLPAPQEWKGTVPKPIHHARILKRLGWKYAKAGSKPKEGYCYPTEDKASKYGLESDKINRGDWKHIMDAIGLAMWARDQYMKGVK